MRRRTDAHAVTNAENSYDYAGQDPINSYDLSGLFLANAGGDCETGSCGGNAPTFNPGGIASPGTIVSRITGGERVAKIAIRVSIAVGAGVAVAACTAATAGICAGVVVPALFAIAAGSAAGTADYYLSPRKHTASGAFNASVTGALVDGGGFGYGLGALFEKMTLAEAEKTFTRILVRAATGR